MQRKRLVFEIPWPSKPITWLAASLRTWLPSRGNVLFTLLVVGGLLWASSAGAFPLGVPTASTSTGTIAYQGRLADTSGNPITATMPMIFRLYNAATGGVPLWEEQWTGSNSVRISDGLFNVMLGSLNAIPQSVVTGNANLWLGITVNADNEMQPRVQLGSVPFAVQALTVPDGAITSAKFADGSVTEAKLADGSVTRSKLANSAMTQVIQLSTAGEQVKVGMPLSTIPGLETTLTVEAAEVVEIQLNAADVYADANGGGGDFVILIDGTTKVLGAIGVSGLPANMRAPITLSWVETLGPGSHTIAAAWQVPSWAPPGAGLHIGGNGKARLIIKRYA